MRPWWRTTRRSTASSGWTSWPAPGWTAPQPFACTVLLSRRLYPQAPSHKLGTLADYHRLPRTGQAHRALADAEMAAALLARIQADLRASYRVAEPTHALLMALQTWPRAAVPTAARQIPLRGVKKGVAGGDAAAQVRRTTTLPIE